MKIFLKMKNFCEILICLIITISTSSGENIKSENYFAINWQKGFVTARGFASVEFENGTPVDTTTGEIISLNKARKASYDAAREMSRINIAEAVKHLRIDPQNNMFDIMAKNNNTQRFISDALIKHIIYKNYPAGFDSSACEARLNFRKIIETLPYDFPSNDFPVRAEIPISTTYTSLIVDCRGFPVKPMLFPSIYSDEGLEIYGRIFIQSNYAVKGGMVSYCYDEKQAMLNPRTGENPYFANAVKSINSCPVLSEKDVRRILSSKITRKNLKQCKVVLIIDTE